MALAHDEWLELNNKEFAMYPSVRTLDGMSRQGQFICVTQKAKWVIEIRSDIGSYCSSERNGIKGELHPREEIDR